MLNALIYSGKRLYIRKVAITLLFAAFVQTLCAQTEKYVAIGWQLKDFGQDSVFGAGVDKAYSLLLKGKKAIPVIVAVIDTGVDSAQEDLSPRLWTNPGEIPGNGVDDDHNGYADDVHGWNFLGSTVSRNVEAESYEAYREYYRLRPSYCNAGSAHTAAEQHYWEKVKALFLSDSVETVQALGMVSKQVSQMHFDDSILQGYIHKTSLGEKDIRDVQSSDSVVRAARKNALWYFKKYSIDPYRTFEDFIDEANQYLHWISVALDGFREDPESVRKDIVGDNPNDIHDRNYGNNNISAGSTSHGTHVAGIIAATRNNGRGIDGIADQVLIMAIRAVPVGGDERDKDIALAIRYAVDNGARVINMSFDKPLSPGKKWVDDAVRYAAEKDVLLVHAAGNNKADLDSTVNFPNPDYLFPSGRAENFITVAANSGGPDSMIVSRLSNFGGREVDLFAPGVAIYSTVPGNKYKAFSGTSFAAPVVTGIAALIMEYYPRLSARQVKEVLTKSVMKFPGLMVKSPVNGKLIDFSGLSRSGGIVNAYNALQLAATLKGERKGP
jgi:cell wall-associated protease